MKRRAAGWRMLDPSEPTEVFMLMALLVGTALAQECDGPTLTATTLSNGVRDALRAYPADHAAFQRATDEAQAKVACVESLVPAYGAAALHLNVGLARLLEGRRDAAAAAFRAARAADPKLTLPEDVAPPGSEAATLWAEAAAAPPAERKPLALRAGATVWADGVEVPGLPDGVPAVVQVGFDRRVTWSAYAAEGVPVALPPYLTPPAYAETTRAPRTVAQKQKTAKILTWSGAGGAAVGAGALYGLAVQARGEFDEDPSPERQSRTNGLVLGSGAAGVVAAGLTGLALVVTF